MRVRETSIKVIAVLIALGVSIAIGAFCGATRTHASAAGGSSSIFGTFTWGANQTGRLVVTAPATGQWSSGRESQVVLGFDVFRPSTNITGGQQANGSCLKHHMIERQACQVTLGPGEAASFDVNGDGVSSFQPVIMPGDGNVKELMITLEVMEAGRIVTALCLPAAQQKMTEDRQ
jgi:hypothetical protein